MRRFYAPKKNLDGERIILGLEETRHLRDVLRLRASGSVQVFDGEGNEFLCEIEKISKQETHLKIVRKIAPSSPESNLDLTLAIALLKGEKFDLVIQKAVELGATKIIPVITKRADVKIKDAKEAEKKLERWRKIALEASKQSGRARLMQIKNPQTFNDFIQTSASQRLGVENLLLFSERGGAEFAGIKTGKKITAVIGSEGGWDDSEIELASEKGFQIITLGGRIMRAETAAIAVAAILQNRFGDLN